MFQEFLELYYGFPVFALIHVFMIFKGLVKFKRGPKQDFTNRHYEPSMLWHRLKASFFLLFGLNGLIGFIFFVIENS